MQQPQMLTRDIYDVDIWYHTYDPNFIELSKRSNVPYKWLTYRTVDKAKYEDSILKPINRYVEALYPPPTLVSIEGNTITLRQGNHAEMFLLREKDGTFYNVDRPWMRQYYQSAQKHDLPEDCFEGLYKFYTPWIIDANLQVKFLKPAEETPFYVYESNGFFANIPKDAEFIEPLFVAFHFKNTGPHMDIDRVFGKIRRQSAMFYMQFEADDIIVERVKEFYGQD